MMRGDVYDARLSPTEGSEQAGMRPVIIVSRNAINQYSPVIVVVPLTDAANLKRTYSPCRPESARWPLDTAKRSQCSWCKATRLGAE